jgi:pimeloyl-ACP methyl ester carboxylesterase
MATILFLHGALGSSTTFESLILKLQDPYSCHAIDFPLHGNNARPFEFTVAEFAKYFIQFIEENYTQKISVFGYSMGGYVALYAASLRPELFDSVMTFETKFKWTEEIAAKEIAMLNTDKMEQKIPAFVTQLKQRHQQIDWKDLVNKTASLLHNLGTNKLLDQLRLNSIPVKVMVGQGDKSEMIKPEETIDVFRQLQDGSFYVLPNTKHAFDKVNEKLLLSHITQFFNY